MPNRIEWDPSFSVGHPMLDLQHQRLLAQCNALADCLALSGRESDLKFHGILHELSDYARTHFSTEEQLLKSVHYPFIEEQIKEHREFQEVMIELNVLAMGGILDKLQTQRMVADWWGKHILGSDMQYIPYFNNGYFT